MFVCNVCGKEFKVKVNLKTHVESQCGTAPQYICQICGKAFLTRWALVNHGLVHSGEKAFLCRFCGKSYRLKVELQRHERSHTGEKPFICKVCGKAFCHRESLVTHSTLHTGIRRYLCEVCGCTFSCIGNLVKHHRRHRWTQPSNQLTRDELRQSTQTSDVANVIACTSDQNTARSDTDGENTENVFQVLHTTSDALSSDLQPNAAPDCEIGDKNNVLETNNNKIFNKELTVNVLPTEDILNHTLALVYNYENKLSEMLQESKEIDQVTQESGSMLSNADGKKHNRSQHYNLEAAASHNQQSNSLVHNYELLPLPVNSTTQQQNVFAAKSKNSEGPEINTANFEREIPAKNENAYSLTLYFHRSNPELDESNIKVSVAHSGIAVNIDTKSQINICNNEVNTTEGHKSNDSMLPKSATGKHLLQEETEGILLEGSGKENNSDNPIIDEALGSSPPVIVTGGYSTKTAAHKSSSIALNKINQMSDEHSYLQQRIFPEICCNMQFDNLYQLKKHRKSHTREKKGSMQCTHCGKRYTNKTCLIKHETQHLAGIFPCNICEEEFLTKTEHRIHCAEQHSHSWRCEDCHRSFSSSSSLRYHRNSKHNDAAEPRLYVCDICGKSFRQKGNLKVHVDSQCGSEPKNVCNVCGKAFLTSGSLSTHLLLHTGEKTFLCRFCGKSYRLKVQMQRHERCHTGEKPFVCKVCGKAFAHRESLVTHSTLHTGIRPYMCEACGCRFSCIGNLVKHKQRQIHNRKCDNANQILSR